MKKILLILDGILSKHYLERVTKSSSIDNIYDVIYYNDDILPNVKVENLRYFKFDPTSLSKLTHVMQNDYIQIIMILATKSDTQTVLKHLNTLKISSPISVLDKWNLNTQDYSLKYLTLLNSNNFLASRMIDELPNIPSIAQNIGLGIGEIMEVKVPFGSSYVYRHISSIEQNNFKIVALYRGAQMLIVNDHHVIQPNDSLLLIGKADVLKNIYHVIKNESGQFPSPFGNNIYLYLDTISHSMEAIKRMLKDALYFHHRTKNYKLYIRVNNPSDNEKLKIIKSYEYRDIFIELSYEYDSFENTINNDIKNFDVGLIVVDNYIFFDKVNLLLLYNLNIPVLKVGYNDSSDADDLVVFVNGYYPELISSIVFDISNQLELNIKLLDYDPEGVFRNATIEHYQNISKIFQKNIDVIQQKKNPIREAKKYGNFIQVIPFSEDITKSNSISKYLSTNSDILIQDMYEYNQLFIPISN